MCIGLGLWTSDLKLFSPMTFLPIVDRELRERARWRSTYWVRGLVAFFATAIAAFVLMFVTAAAPGAVGKWTLATLAWLAFPFVVLEGLRNTADSLSEEKREGTLGLLFLTDLKGYDVVLGKFFASSLTSFYALLAMIPALAIPVLLGGVTGGEFWRLVLALINALFFSLTAGTFISSISRDERKAWSGTFVLIGLFIIAIPAFAATFGVTFWNAQISVFSPFTAFILYDENRYAADRYWNSLWITHLLGWGWLALASFLLPRVWQESRRRTERRRVREPEHARRGRNEMLAVNPIWWLTSRHTHQRAWLWLVVSVVAITGVASWLGLMNDKGALWTIFGCFIAVHLALAVWVGFEACNSFAEARSTGAMELLLSTPLHVRQILRGQHLALRELFMGPLLLLLAVELCMVVAQIWLMTNRGNAGGSVMLVLVLGFCLVWFVLDLFAVAEVGMWYGLTSQKPTQALTKTVLFVLILPLVFLPCCSMVGPGLMVAKSVIFFTWAQSKLENEFRRAATERYDLPRTSKWMRRTPPRLRMPGELKT
jgi:ABC-type transport system involved in multi-copper enzyme maturation permease subunit